MAIKRFKILVLAIVVVSISAQGAYLRNVPQTIVQPDGRVIHCFASGDEYYNWLHDKDDYTIIQDPHSGFYVYAVKNIHGELEPSMFIVGIVDPKSLGLEKGVKRSPQKLEQSRSLFIQNSVQAYALPAPRTGAINNIVIFIRFSDESEFTDQISTYSNMFNSSQSGANSMFNYFLEASYNALSVSTTFYPTPSTTVVSYQDSQPRAYYKPYNEVTNPIGYQGGDNGTERTNREHALLKNAVNAVSGQIPGGLVVDGDADGYVDNVCFIVYGSPTGWASLLWPHKWSLYSQSAYINGKRVYTYNFQLQASLQSSGVGVLCHEMFHSLGAPDLYHYSYDGLHPVWKWDVMEYNMNPPQHMGAYMKYKYGTWISSIPEITSSGTYSLNPLVSSSNNCYKIRSPYSQLEYFIVEYRQKLGTFENSLPGDGLIVYRIYTTVQGNASGPPDEVYIYRPNGTTTVDGSPDNAYFNSTAGRTAINDVTNPSSFLTGGGQGGLDISSVGSVGSAISFYVAITVRPPTLTTSTVSAINQTAATCGGNVIADGFAAVTERGVCWSTSANPTISNSHTHDGSGTGSFTSNMSGLVYGTTYHVRAYATNSAGTGYGNDISFRTSAGKDDFLGTWDGQGVYYRNSETGTWTGLTSPADVIACGNLYGDGIDDLIGIWSGLVWVKNSANGGWVCLTTAGRDIAAADMNGDGRADFLGTWDGQGVYYKDSINGTWTLITIPAIKIVAGDLDGDKKDDLIGVWAGQGVWVKYSTTGTWQQFSQGLARDIAVGDMNGDGRVDFVGTWDGQGVFYRDSVSGGWVQITSPAEQITTGDFDGDGTDDLIGIWTSQGVWVKYSKTGTWVNLTTAARDIAAGKFRGAVWSSILGGAMKLEGPFGRYAQGPAGIGTYQNLSENSPGGKNFTYRAEKNLMPLESGSKVLRIPGPGEPGFTCFKQENLFPHRELKTKTEKKKK